MSVYPETAADALALWDADEMVWSVEMGGLGPGYEMAIQGLAFEMMRELIEGGKTDENLDDRLDRVVVKFDEEPWAGFSGAQVGAAKSLAHAVWKRGYREALSDPSLARDRIIRVCRKDLRKDTTP